MIKYLGEWNKRNMWIRLLSLAAIPMLVVVTLGCLPLLILLGILCWAINGNEDAVGAPWYIFDKVIIDYRTDQVGQK